MSKPKKTDADGRRSVEKHRQCPICYTGDLNGVGESTSTKGPKTYYKCDKCGHNWSIETKKTVEKINHRDVNLQTRDSAPERLI